MENSQTTEKVYKILNGKQSVDNYPYGRLQCTRTIEVEYNKKRGYRIVTQTINPKTGRLNAPKKSTYSQYIVLFQQEETGHSKGLSFSLNGDESIDLFIKFLKNHSDQLEFTTEQSQDLFIQIISSIKVGAEWISFRIAPEGEPYTVRTYLEDTKLKEVIALYGKKANIKEILNLDLNFTEARLKHEDKENGEAIRSFTSRRIV